MTPIQTFLLMLGLTMDTLAITLAMSLYHEKITSRLVLRVAFHFSLFQTAFLLVGWWLGMSAEEYLGLYDHWIAFILLGAIGTKMFWESFSKHQEVRSDPSRGLSLIALSVANSIDALAVGGSLGLLEIPILLPTIIVLVLTVLISIFGLFIGKKVGKMFGKWAELAGGIVLWLIGIRILLEHL